MLSRFSIVAAALTANLGLAAEPCEQADVDEPFVWRAG